MLPFSFGCKIQPMARFTTFSPHRRIAFLQAADPVSPQTTPERQ
jgi:hypothetical protein